MVRAFLTCGVIVTAATLSQGSVAQTYPTSTVQLIVPFSPATGPDILARTLGDKLSERLKQPFVVMNRPGAGGTIGMGQVARAKPDGYTILVSGGGLFIAAHLTSISFHPVNDFAPISRLATGKLLLVASTKSKIRSVAELLDRAKREPGTLNYASSGVGTPHHLGMEMLKELSGADLTHVPYPGVSGAMADIVGGHADVMFVPIHVGMPYVQSNRVTALAVGSPTRDETAPQLPTLRELGYDIDIDLWNAFLAPAGTPAAAIKLLNSEVHELLALPEIKGVLQRQGLIAAPTSPEETSALMKINYERWGEVIKRKHLK